MKVILVSLIFFLGITVQAQSGDCSGRALDLTDKSSLREVHLDGFSIRLPDCLTPQKKRGIEGWVWVFRTSEFSFTVFIHPDPPKPGGYDRSLPTFTQTNEIIDRRTATIWKYEDPGAEFKYSAAARFAADGSFPQAFTIDLKSDSAALYDFAVRIFRSIKFDYKSFSRVPAHPESDKCRGKTLNLTEKSPLQDVRLYGFSIGLPKCLTPQDSSGWMFRTSEFDFFVFLLPDPPKPSEYESSLQTFTQTSEMIDGRAAMIWKYEDPVARFRYIAAVRFQGDRTFPQGFTIDVRSNSPELHNFAMRIFRSIKFDRKR